MPKMTKVHCFLKLQPAINLDYLFSLKPEEIKQLQEYLATDKGADTFLQWVKDVLRFIGNQD